MRSGIAEGFVYLATVLAIVPLGFVLGYIIVKGAPAISWTFFTTVPNADPFSHDTGISSALVGTLILIGLAALFAVPLGILVAFFMSEARASKSEPAPAGRGRPRLHRRRAARRALDRGRA